MVHVWCLDVQAVIQNYRLKKNVEIQFEAVGPLFAAKIQQWFFEPSICRNIKLNFQLFINFT